MERTLLGSAVSTLSGSLASAWNGLRGKARPGPIPAPVKNRAIGVYSTLSVLGTTDDVVQLYNASSSPTSKDFTATELTDGTYTSWYSSGTTKVTKLYDQQGSINLEASSSVAPNYDASNNLVVNHKPNPYITSTLKSTAADKTTVNSTYGGNTTGQGTTIVGTLKDFTTAGSSSDAPLFVINDDNPTSVLNDRHKGMITQYSTGYIGTSIKDDSYTGLDVLSDDAIDSTLRVFASTLEKTDSSTTTLKAYKGDGLVANTSATTISENIEIVEIDLGGNLFNFQTGMLFTEALSGGDVATLKVELESL